VDDILIWGDSPEDLISNVDLVLTRLESRNVHLRPSKSKFGYRKIFFCGHWLSGVGVELGDDRKKYVQAAPEPRSSRDLKSFLGFAIYFHKFVPQYSMLTKPLHAAAEHGRKLWKWTEELSNQFNVLKNAILDSKFLFHPDYRYPIVVRPDSCNTGVGGVVLNIVPDGERPLIFLSHAFSGAAQRWNTFEKEGFGPVFCCLKCDYILLGHHFFIETDHRNLIWLHESTVPKCQRWYLRLMEFDYTTVHRPGTMMGGPDYISV
jgi:hypothetical protein